MSEKTYHDAPDLGDPLLYAVDVPEEDRARRMDNIADRYEVRGLPDSGGCIIWGRYRGHEWYPNVSARWLVRHLLSERAELQARLSEVAK